MEEKIKQVSQKIFRILNEEYFRNELPSVIYGIRGKRIILKKNVLVNTEEGIKYIIILPTYSILNEWILASYIFESMMFLDEYLKGNSPIRYRGRSYKTLVKKKDYRIECVNYGTEYGYEIKKGTDFFYNFCVKNRIKKEWETTNENIYQIIKGETKEKRICPICNNWFYVPTKIIKGNNYIICSTCYKREKQQNT